MWNLSQKLFISKVVFALVMVCLPCFNLNADEINSEPLIPVVLDSLQSICSQTKSQACQPGGTATILKPKGELNIPIIFFHGLSPKIVHGQPLIGPRYMYDKLNTLSVDNAFVVVPDGGDGAQFFSENGTVQVFIEELHRRLCSDDDSSCSSVSTWKDNLVLIGHSAGGTTVSNQLMSAKITPKAVILLDGINMSAQQTKMTNWLSSNENHIRNFYFYYTNSYDSNHLRLPKKNKTVSVINVPGVAHSDLPQFMVPLLSDLLNDLSWK